MSTLCQKMQENSTLVLKKKESISEQQSNELETIKES